MVFNQQPKPVLNKLQLLTGVAIIAIVGGVAISITNSLNSKLETTPVSTQGLTSEKKPTLQPEPKPEPAPIQPQTNTQIIILTPSNQSQLDCLQYGGGLGCFDGNYQPKIPVHWSEEKRDEPKRGEHRNVGDLLYRFW